MVTVRRSYLRAVVALALLSCGLPEAVDHAQAAVEHRQGAECSCAEELGTVAGDVRCEANPSVLALWRRGYVFDCYPNPDYLCCLWVKYP